MAKSIISSVYIIAMLPLCACVATGKQVKESDIARFHRGHASIAQVVSELGQPNVNTLTPDGKRTICYAYLESAIRPETFIPIVGAFAGGADIRQNSTCLGFTEAGILEKITASSSQSGSGYGLESGSTGGRVAAEPKQSE